MQCLKQVQYYQTTGGRQPVKDWLQDLDKITRRKIHSSIQRVALGGAKKNIRVLGDGVFEIKIDAGPGFRVYFGEVGNVVILLLIGGDKSTQFRDIRQAKDYWRDYVSK